MASVRTTIDKAGRVVIPKELRDGVGLRPGAEVEILPWGDGVRISAVHRQPEARLIEEGGFLLIDHGEPPETLAETLAARDSLRERRR